MITDDMYIITQYWSGGVSIDVAAFEFVWVRSAKQTVSRSLCRLETRKESRKSDYSKQFSLSCPVLRTSQASVCGRGGVRVIPSPDPHLRRADGAGSDPSTVDKEHHWLRYFAKPSPAVAVRVQTHCYLWLVLLRRASDAEFRWESD